AVVVEVDAVSDGRGDEPKHAVAVMGDGIAVAAHRSRDPEVDAEARPEPLNAGRHAVPSEDFLQTSVETLGDGVDVLVEARLAIRRHCRQGSRHRRRVAVVRAAMLTIADRHEPVHDVAPAAKRAQGEAAADRLAEGTQAGRYAQ